MVNLVGALLLDMVFSHVNKAPDFGEEHVAENMIIRPGGLANIIFPLSKLGVTPRVISTLGKDEFGQRIYQELSPLIDNNIILTDKDTSISIGIVNKNGDRYFVTFNKNLLDFTPEVVNLDSNFKNAKVSFFYGYFLLPNYGFNGTLKALKKAKQYNHITYFDCNSDIDGWKDKKREEIYHLLPYIDFFMPNDEELLKLTKRSSIDDAAEELLDHGARNVIVTQGAKGATAFSKDGKVHHSGFPTKAFDTTGAGDSFNAGFLYAQLSDFSINKSLAFANSLASIVVARKENRYPTVSEIQEVYEID